MRQGRATPHRAERTTTSRRRRLRRLRTSHSRRARRARPANRTIPARPTDTSSLRKQVYDLKPSDLEQYAIWEHALDEEGVEGQDEATVKPRPDLASADPGEGMLVVRAELVANDGTRYDGYVYPPYDGKLRDAQPTVVRETGQVRFWFGAFPPREGALDESYALLGTTAERLFPLMYRALVEHEGARLEGTITGFVHGVLGSAETVELR